MCRMAYMKPLAEPSVVNNQERHEEKMLELDAAMKYLKRKLDEIAVRVGVLEDKIKYV